MSKSLNMNYVNCALLVVVLVLVVMCCVKPVEEGFIIRKLCRNNLNTYCGRKGCDRYRNNPSPCGTINIKNKDGKYLGFVWRDNHYNQYVDDMSVCYKKGLVTKPILACRHHLDGV